MASSIHCFVFRYITTSAVASHVAYAQRADKPHPIDDLKNLDAICIGSFLLYTRIERNMVMFEVSSRSGSSTRVDLSEYYL